MGRVERSITGLDDAMIVRTGDVRVLSTPRDGRCILSVSHLCSMLLIIQQEPSELYYHKVRKVHLTV